MPAVPVMMICLRAVRKKWIMDEIIMSDERIMNEKRSTNEIKTNKRYILDISGMNHEGQGVGRIGGFAVFVDGALEGEKVEADIMKVSGNYAAGKLARVIEPSPCRISPFCNVYGRCGGCGLQHMEYGVQLKFKENVVREAIKRIGGLGSVAVHPAIGMREPFKYRNKAQYPLKRVNGRIVAGFYAKRSHEVVECGECGIQDGLSGKIVSLAKDFIERKHISVYDEKTGKGLVRHIMTRVGFRSGEAMAVIVINGEDMPGKEELVHVLTKEIPEVNSIFLNINTRNTNVILGDKNIRIYGSGTIADYIGTYEFRISPASFFQVNPVQTGILYEKALEYASLSGNETVLDLYCGIGTIAIFMAGNAKKVIGIEEVGEAVRDAAGNAKLNGVSNVEFVAGKVEDVLPEMARAGVRADAAVIDPPRRGCGEAALKAVAAIGPDRIVYVSCNPATLARDVGRFAALGYEVAEVQPVDMFPWTAHVECVVLMTNVKNG